MKLHPTVALSLLLLIMMGGAGAASGVWSYALGREALKSVTQPDMRPTQQRPVSQPAAAGDSEELTLLLDETEILQQVNDIINGKVPAETETADAEAAAAAASPTPEVADLPVAEINAALPMQGRDGDVTLEVTEASQVEGSLLLAVNLRNEGEEPVRFLYSFLAVSDEQGRALSAITDGLPSELPPNGQAFDGTIKIPLALIEDSQTISLMLSDYPERRLQLSLTNIPVVQ
ncbi:MAG: hypothetical protein HC910_18845 [Spirulinaceae cyanobacterium SM2_1_0]|nr:hypothetical protein [Spirulinaceae cyanobacterium SM2_1_0]